MERKKFIKQTCSLCMLLGAGFSITELASCTASSILKTDISNNQTQVPIASFAERDLQIIQPKNFGYNIALQKQKDGTYTALLMRCTHADNPLQSTGTEFTCSLHGSIFDRNGNVVQGPAEIPLQKMKTHIQQDNIIIQLN